MSPLRARRYVADQDEDPFREARDRVQRIEADLHRPADPPDEDRVSVMARDLAERAGALEREIRPGRDASPGEPAVFPRSRPR